MNALAMIRRNRVARSLKLVPPKAVMLLVGMATVAAVSVGVWRANANQAPGFRTLPIEKGDLVITVSATGSTEPVEIVEVGPRVTGHITAIGADPSDAQKLIDVGSRIQEGDVLAQLDDSLYKVELQQAKANLRLANAEIVRLNAQLAQTKRNLDRAYQLRETNSESQYESVLTAHEMALAELQIGQARVEQAATAVTQAEINLRHTTIRAPIDGVVIDRYVNLGQAVVAKAGAPGMFLLAKDLGQMRVRAAVSEADIGQVHVGQRVTFKVDAHRDETFEGHVEKIMLNANTNHNVVAYDVMVTIDHQPVELLPHMTANLQFEIARREQVRLVPTEALRWQPTSGDIAPEQREALQSQLADDDNGESKQGGTATIWVLEDDQFVRAVNVQVGLDDGAVCEIAGDQLRPNMRVVLGSLHADDVPAFIKKKQKRR